MLLHIVKILSTFLGEVNVTVIKGNASEILTLIDFNTTMKGTDSDSELDSVNIAKKRLIL